MFEYSEGPVHLENAADLAKALSDSFIAEITNAIETQTGRAGLEDCCKDGGSVTDVEISAVVIEPYDDDEPEVYGSFKVSFAETYYSGCKDIEFRNNFSGDGTFTITLDKNEMEVRVGVLDEEEAKLIAAMDEEETERHEAEWFRTMETKENPRLPPPEEV